VYKLTKVMNYRLSFLWCFILTATLLVTDGVVIIARIKFPCFFEVFETYTCINRHGLLCTFCVPIFPILLPRHTACLWVERVKIWRGFPRWKNTAFPQDNNRFWCCFISADTSAVH